MRILEQMEYFVLIYDGGRRDNIFTQHATCVALIRLIIHSRYVFTHLSVFFYTHYFVSFLFFSSPFQLDETMRVRQPFCWKLNWKKEKNIFRLPIKYFIKINSNYMHSISFYIIKKEYNAHLDSYWTMEKEKKGEEWEHARSSKKENNYVNKQ